MQTLKGGNVQNFQSVCVRVPLYDILLRAHHRFGQDLQEGASFLAPNFADAV